MATGRIGKRAVDAMRMLQERKAVGKVVIEM